MVPNGTLFGEGVATRIKQDLLDNYNLHTIVRLPNGVFSPYTSIATNVLFFDRSGPTRDIWYYDHPLPNGRKTYTKTQPLQFEEFIPLLEWWKDRNETDCAWRVPVDVAVKTGYNLDIRNPNLATDLEHLHPAELVGTLLAEEHQIVKLLSEIRDLVDTVSR